MESQKSKIMSNEIPKNLTPPPSGKISEFYQGAHIFLTGATGFVGKVILEKLLRSCDASGNIYVLIRPKKEQTPQERLKKLLESPPFAKLRETNPKSFEKIKLVYGDLEQENVGLSENDRKMLIDNVNIVLHVAANVSFTLPLETAVKSNTLGTKCVIELCKDMPRLKSFVYVSTAYSNNPEPHEIIYEIPYDPNFMISLVENLPSDVIQTLTKKLQGNYPNTYSFSKALAEKFVSDSADFLPAVIVRPSTVHSSWKEPFPGWVDSWASMTPYIRLFNLGIYKTVMCNKKLMSNLIPVDVVANTVLTAAWHSTTNKSSSVKVYNCCTGILNGLSYEDFSQHLQHNIQKLPSKHLIGYPTHTLRTNRIMHQVGHFFHHLLPAFAYDAFLFCTNRKPRMVGIYKKILEMEKTFEFVSVQNRKFHVRNFEELIESVGRAEDGGKFNIDIRKGKGFNWDSYLKDYQMGFRKYIMKEDMATLNFAKTKLKRLYWTKKAVQFTFTFSIIGVVLGSNIFKTEKEASPAEKY